jgi:hypothetical protein
MRVPTAAFVVCALLLSLLAAPAGLSAKERRGARIIVTRLDGSQAEGELIAVKPDSLLLLNAAGQDESAALAEIKTVRIVRRSRALPLALIGFMTGAAEGAFAASRDSEDRETKVTVFWAGIIGGAQALLGTGIGIGLGADAILRFAGETGEVVGRYLDRLKGYSREGRLHVRPEEHAIRPKVPRVGPSPQPSVPQRLARPPRFRLSLATVLDFGTGYHKPQVTEGSWRFPGNVPPEESGPRAWPVYNYPFVGPDQSAFFWGPISLAYAWTERWLTEIEWWHLGGLSSLLYTGNPYAQTTFVLTADGKTYAAYLPPPPYPNQRVDIDALFLGLNYRLLAPGRLNRASLEVGAGAGPARVRIIPNEGVIPADRKTVLAARVHAAFDFYFVPAFSLGAFLTYRTIHVSFPSVTGTGEVAFYDVNDVYPYDTVPVIRLTEVTVPVRPVSRSTLAVGLRLTFRL